MKKRKGLNFYSKKSFNNLTRSLLLHSKISSISFIEIILLFSPSTSKYTFPFSSTILYENCNGGISACFIKHRKYVSLLPLCRNNHASSFSGFFQSPLTNPRIHSALAINAKNDVIKYSP